MYTTITRNMNARELVDFETKISSPDRVEEMMDKQNAEQMKLLTGGKTPPKPTPLPHRRRKRE